MNIAELFIRVGADISGLKQGMAEAQSSVQRAGVAMQSAGKKLTAGITLPLAAVGAAAFGAVTRVGALADELLDLRDQTGLSTDTLQEFRHVATVAGVGSDTLANAAIKLTTALSGTGEESAQLGDALARLGVSARDADGALIPMDQLLPSIITGLQGTEDQTTRNALAADIFGRSWAELAPVLSLGADGLADARQQARDLGLVLSGESLEAADAFRLKMETLKSTLGANVSAIGIELLPAMTALANFITERVVPAVQAMVQFAGDLVARWQALTPQTQAFLGVAIGLAAALGPVLLIGGKLLAVIVGLNPVVVLAAAAFMSVVAAGVAITENWGVLKYEAGLLIEKVAAIGAKFKWLYDVTVGRSYVPDMVDGIGSEFNRLGGIFTGGLDAIVDFAMGGADAIGKFVERAVQDITRLLLKMALVAGLRAIFSGATGGVGGFVLGALEGRAAGGPVQAGRPYLVGERGPEMFVPSSAGSIVPNGGASAAAIMNILPIGRPMTPREAARDAWHRDLIRLIVADNNERG